MTAADRRSEKKHVDALGELKVGDAVWYRPSVMPGQPRYPAVVDAEVRMLGETSVVRLRDLPESYWRQHHPDTKRTTVSAAALFAIDRRVTPDSEAVVLQPCADCGHLCREIDSPRAEHAADCPHWEDTTTCVRCHATMSQRDGDEPTAECDHCAHELLAQLRTRVTKMEEAITNAIEMFSGEDGGPVEGIDWSGEIGLLRLALKEDT